MEEVHVYNDIYNETKKLMKCRSGQPEKNSENLLFQELGTGMSEALFDLLLYFEGPKIRDKLSHGVLDCKTVGMATIHTIVSIVLSLCHRSGAIMIVMMHLMYMIDTLYVSLQTALLWR